MTESERHELDVSALASGFYRALCAAMTAEQMHSIRRRNALHALAGRDCCASHEFCDANMLMLEAHTEHFEAEPAFLLEGMDSDAGQKAATLWDAAWTKARKEALTDPDARKAELGAAYVAAIGYDPFEDDATQSADEIAAILAEHAAIVARGGLD